MAWPVRDPKFVIHSEMTSFTSIGERRWELWNDGKKVAVSIGTYPSSVIDEFIAWLNRDTDDPIPVEVAPDRDWG